MSIKLIAIDIDGTLLNSKGEILDSTKKVITATLNKGVRVVLCSGRPVDGLKEYLNELGIKGSGEYVITLNGAIIRNADSDIIEENLIPGSFYREMTAFGLANKIPFNIVDSESRIITADHNIDPMIYQQAYENHAPLYIRNPDEIPKDNIRISKGCYVGDPLLLDQWEEKVKKQFGKALNVIRTDPSFLELLNKQVDKGSALKQLAEDLDLKKEQVMAIGDERNDLTMFDYASIAVCMGNGHEEAKKAANYVTSSNDEDGIKQAIEKFVL